MAIWRGWETLRTRVAERRSRLMEHGEELSGPVESLRCPRCLRSYAFGDNCPRCGTELVGSTMVSAERDAVPARHRLRNHPVLALALALGIVLGSVVLTAWIGRLG